MTVIPPACAINSLPPMNTNSSHNTQNNNDQSSTTRKRSLTDHFYDEVSSLSYATSSTKKTIATVSTQSSSRAAASESTRVELTNFRELPPFEAFRKVSWSMVGCQVIAGIFGALLSYYQNNGMLGGILSGIVGVWFIQMSWVSYIYFQIILLILCFYLFWFHWYYIRKESVWGRVSVF